VQATASGIYGIAVFAQSQNTGGGTAVYAVSRSGTGLEAHGGSGQASVHAVANGVTAGTVPFHG
jgi:hypothetical protein